MANDKRPFNEPKVTKNKQRVPNMWEQRDLDAFYNNVRKGLGDENFGRGWAEPTLETQPSLYDKYDRMQRMNGSEGVRVDRTQETQPTPQQPFDANMLSAEVKNELANQAGGFEGRYVDDRSRKDAKQRGLQRPNGRYDLRNTPGNRMSHTNSNINYYGEFPEYDYWDADRVAMEAPWEGPRLETMRPTSVAKDNRNRLRIVKPMYGMAAVPFGMAMAGQDPLMNTAAGLGMMGAGLVNTAMDAGMVAQPFMDYADYVQRPEFEDERWRQMQMMGE